MSFTYRVYGLTISVPFACAALAPADAAHQAAGPADVVVRPGTVPSWLRAPRSAEAQWDAAPGLFLLRGDRRSARFLVDAGTVTFERGPDSDDTIVARSFVDDVLPAVLRHRGLLVLHANAVAVPWGGAVVTAGDSGAGKSTLLAALLRHGCRMLSDDVTALRLGEGRRVEVVPGVAQTRLGKEAAESLGYRVDPAQFQPWRRMKAAIPTRDSMAQDPGPLRAFYSLRISDGDEVSLTALNGTDKFWALQESVYGPMFPQEHPALFPLLTTAVTAVPFFRLERPAARWSVDEVVGAVLQGVGEPA